MIVIKSTMAIYITQNTSKSSQGIAKHKQKDQTRMKSKDISQVASKEVIQ